MAASTGSIVQTVTETDAEIEELKSKYAGNVKVIRDMGDFKFMIDVKTVKVTLKFQIDGSYPNTAPQIIVRSDQLSVQQKDELMQALTNKSSILLGQPMLCALAAFAVSETEEIPTVECVKPK
ncbi:hypothetical protein CAPTEDRAFT_211351, partial [Capitella teleta]